MEKILKEDINSIREKFLYKKAQKDAHQKELVHIYLRNLKWILKATGEIANDLGKTAGVSETTSFLNKTDDVASKNKNDGPYVDENAQVNDVEWKTPDNASTCKGDPVDVGTGDLLQQLSVLTLPGVLTLTLSRTYRSRSACVGLFGPTKWMDGHARYNYREKHSILPNLKAQYILSATHNGVFMIPAKDISVCLAISAGHWLLLICTVNWRGIFHPLHRVVSRYQV